MNETSYTPRVKKLDVPFYADRLKDFMTAKARAEESLRAQQESAAQGSAAAVSSNAGHVAFYEFGLGYPLGSVRQAFAEAANAARKVFQLRGTRECRPDLPGVKDYSLTNSRACLDAICMALIAGEEATAQNLADLMEDPPDASYLGHDSEVCTINQQHLAYAVKHLLGNHQGEVEKELRRLSNRKGEQQVAAMGKMVRGLAKNSDAIFNEGLLELLFFHRKWARRAENDTDPRRFFSLGAVGLSILAVRRGLLTKVALPRDEYLPLELIPEGRTDATSAWTPPRPSPQQ